VDNFVENYLICPHLRNFKKGLMDLIGKLILAILGCALCQAKSLFIISFAKG
jgi:hypothetical protein